MIILIAGVCLLILIFLLVKGVKHEEEKVRKLNELDNFEELYNTVERDIELTDRQGVLVDKVNKLKEKQNSVKTKLED